MAPSFVTLSVTNRMYSINSNRDFYEDVYTILNRIKLTIWTICAFRVLNPRQWSFAKQSSSKSWKFRPQKCQNKLKPKGWCNTPTKLQFQSISNRKILMLFKRYESTEVDRITWLHVPSGTHWSTSSDTHQVVKIQIETSTKMYTPFLIGLN